MEKKTFDGAFRQALGPNPFWVAQLENSNLAVVGRPSWVRLPGLTSLDGMTDWQRLKRLCEEKHYRLRALSLTIPSVGKIEAPTGMGGYGFFEEHTLNMRGGGGCTGLAICWAESNGLGNRRIKVQVISPFGSLETRIVRKWQPCMIGDPEWIVGKDDGTPLRDGTIAATN